MKPEINQQQTNWISQVEELDDSEASQVNGGGVWGAIHKAATPIVIPMAEKALGGLFDDLFGGSKSKGNGGFLGGGNLDRVRDGLGGVFGGGNKGNGGG